MGDIDTSSGGSVAERLARLKASKQQAPILPPKPSIVQQRAPPPPPRTNTSSSIASITERQTLPPPLLTKPKPPPLPSRSRTTDLGSKDVNGSRVVMGRMVPPVFATKSAIDLGSQTADIQLPNQHPPVHNLETSKRPVPPLPSRTTSGTRTVPPLPQLPARKQATVVTTDRNCRNNSAEAAEKTEVQPSMARRLPPPASQAPPPPPKPAQKPQESKDIPKYTRFERPPPVPTNRPPTVNMSSRPAAASVDAYNAEMAACLICRDFRRVDTHASRPEFSRMQVTSISGLAFALTDPFPDTVDKARVIFTWLHHNITYDVASFFAKSVGPQGPENTMRTGLAVCDGYSQLYKALAQAAGLKCERVGGYGAGYGHSDRSPPSKYEGNHAWNAVLLPEPHGWHLLDACWGAGHLGPDNQYKKVFNPSQFTMSPKEFGKKHFPEKAKWQCILNPISWQEFINPTTGPGPKIWDSEDKKNWKVHSVYPWVPVLPRGRVRIELQRTCQHWKEKKLAGEKGYLVVAYRKNKHPFPFREVDQFGTIAVELDVDADEEVSIGPLNTINGKDAKGLTPDEWIPQMGKVGWGGGGYLVTWGHRD